MLKIIYFSLLLLSLFGCKHSDIENINQQKTPRLYRSSFTERPPIIDGKYDSVWENTKWTLPFVDIEGSKTPKYTIKMKML